MCVTEAELGEGELRGDPRIDKSWARCLVTASKHMRNEGHRTGGRMISQSLNGQESGQRAAGRGRGNTERLQVAKAGSLLLRSCPRVGKSPLFVLGKFRSKRRVEQRNIHIIPECLGTKICGHSSFLCREPGCTGAPIPRAYTVFSFPDHVDSGRLLSLGLSFLVCKMETIIVPMA